MKKMKQISALIGLILIVSLYLLSFISAIFATEHAPGLFIASIFSTVVIPIMIYGYIVVYKHVHRDDPKYSKDPENLSNEISQNNSKSTPKNHSKSTPKNRSKHS